MNTYITLVPDIHYICQGMYECKTNQRWTKYSSLCHPHSWALYVMQKCAILDKSLKDICNEFHYKLYFYTYLVVVHIPDELVHRSKLLFYDILKLFLPHTDFRNNFCHLGWQDSQLFPTLGQILHLDKAGCPFFWRLPRDRSKLW